MTARHKDFLTWMLSLFLANSFAQHVLAQDPAGPEPVSQYPGRFERIAGSPLVSFFATNSSIDPRLNFFRFWGVTVDASVIPNEMLEGEFICKHMGMVWASGAGNARVVFCTKGGVDFGEALIREGYGQEICEESGNFYGTCNGMERMK